MLADLFGRAGSGHAARSRRQLEEGRRRSARARRPTPAGTSPRSAGPPGRRVAPAGARRCPARRSRSRTRAARGEPKRRSRAAQLPQSTASPFEHGQQQLATKSSLDIASSTGLDHVWYCDACCLGQSVLGLLVESVAVVDDPDRPDRLVRRPGSRRPTAPSLVDLGQAAREDSPQGRAVCAHHARCRQHLAIERTHPRESGTWRPRIEPTTGSVDRLVAERRIGEYAACRILDRDRAADHPATAFASAKRSPIGTPAIPAAAPVTVAKRLGRAGA